MKLPKVFLFAVTAVVPSLISAHPSNPEIPASNDPSITTQSSSAIANAIVTYVGNGVPHLHRIVARPLRYIKPSKLSSILKRGYRPRSVAITLDEKNTFASIDTINDLQTRMKEDNADAKSAYEKGSFGTNSPPFEELEFYLLSARGSREHANMTSIDDITHFNGELLAQHQRDRISFGILSFKIKQSPGVEWSYHARLSDLSIGNTLDLSTVQIDFTEAYEVYKDVTSVPTTTTTHDDGNKEGNGCGGWNGVFDEVGLVAGDPRHKGLSTAEPLYRFSVQEGNDNDSGKKGIIMISAASGHLLTCSALMKQ